MNRILPTFLSGNKDFTLKAQARILEIQAVVEETLMLEAQHITYDLVLMEKVPHLMERLKPNLPEQTLFRVEDFRRQVPAALGSWCQLIEEARTNKRFISKDWLETTASPSYTLFHAKIVDDLNIINHQVVRLYFMGEDSPVFGLAAAESVRRKQDAALHANLQAMNPSMQPPQANAPVPSMQEQVREQIMAGYDQIRTQITEELDRVRLDVEVQTLFPQLAELRPRLQEDTIAKCRALSDVTYPNACRSLVQQVAAARNDPHCVDQAWLTGVAEELKQLIPKMRLKIRVVQSAVHKTYGAAFLGDLGLFAAADSVDHENALARDKLHNILLLQHAVEEMKSLFLDRAYLAMLHAEHLQHQEDAVHAAVEFVEEGNEELEAAIELLPLPSGKAGLAAGVVCAAADVAVHLVLAKCAVSLVGIAAGGHVLLVFAVPAGVVYGGCVVYNAGFFRGGESNLMD